MSVDSTREKSRLGNEIDRIALKDPPIRFRTTE
jgi:hypothetical protein